MATIISRPKRGDIATKRIADKTPVYFQLEGFILEDIDTTVYEIVGVVAGIIDNQVLVCYKSQSGGLKWTERCEWTLGGYTLDGTARVGKLKLRRDTAGTIDKFGDVEFPYSATTEQELCDAINTVFVADEVLAERDFYAYTVDGVVHVSCAWSIYNDFGYSKGKTASENADGFTLTLKVLDGVSYSSKMRHANGAPTGEGCISNIERAKVFFLNDNTNETYNPTTEASVRRTYPLCLPAYLGKSPSRLNADGSQNDYCAKLREKYGEGEDGWLNFLRSLFPVIPCDNGVMGVKDGKRRTASLAVRRYSSNKVSDGVLCPAANYAYSITTPTIDTGEFWMPTLRELYMLIKDVHYDTNSNREADILNKGLKAISATALSNSAYLWSCVRYLSNSAWCALGFAGFFGSNSMCSTYVVRPVSLYSL